MVSEIEGLGCIGVCALLFCRVGFKGLALELIPVRGEEDDPLAISR